MNQRWAQIGGTVSFAEFTVIFTALAVVRLAGLVP
ncbi:hypothetical protein SAMN05216360_12922 [Methylobacterium phyllostachyos]|uniref:Uncharacterized protein n=1 Tax=Methylobacterium phyllostachyos TaxID=582672 RepID=A0A1H0KV42_9HYPH|nr:hypothetical protein SAMN05216360_12922 [Methylobacterium phyllostachyos]